MKIELLDENENTIELHDEHLRDDCDSVSIMQSGGHVCTVDIDDLLSGLRAFEDKRKRFHRAEKHRSN